MIRIYGTRLNRLVRTGPTLTLSTCWNARTAAATKATRARTQRRDFSLSDRIWDVVRTGKLNPPNPIMIPLHADVPSRETLPNFAETRPHHLVQATQLVQDDYLANFNKLELALQQQQQQQHDQSTITCHWLLNELERLEAPSFFVANVALIYHVFRHTVEWKRAVRESAFIRSAQPHQHSHIIMGALKRLESQFDDAVDECTRVAIRRYLQQYIARGVQHKDEEALRTLEAACNDLHLKLLPTHDSPRDTASPTFLKERLETIHSYIAVRTQKATLLGYESHTQMALADWRMAKTMEDVTALHLTVAERLLPIVTATSQSTVKEAEGNIQLSQYLTLDGVLQGMFNLTNDLFGIVIQEDSNVTKSWNNEVRLFHVTDEATNQYISSFYLDPFQRPNKSRIPLMGPIQGNTSMFLCCNIQLPPWNHMPTELKIGDLESLFHEFGHALQCILMRSKYTALGAHAMQYDVSEMMPKFMEHWLLDERVLESLAHLSRAEKPFPKDLIKSIQTQRSLKKAFSTLHHIFHGQLELEVFANTRGDESLVAMQRRLAEQFIPHDMPPKRDLSPLTNVVSNDAVGGHVALYRYVWSEVMSADIFTMFQDSGITDQKAMRQLGKRLQTCMLEPDASLDNRQAFLGLRGREMSCDALFQLYGF